MQHMLEINENKQKTETILSYQILCPLCHLHQRKQMKMKFIQFKIYFNLDDQAHIVNNKKASTKPGHLIAQVKIHQ